MRFEDFVLHLDSSSRGFRARVLKSPFGEGAVGFSLPSTAGEEPAIHGSSAASRDIVRAAAATGGTRPPLEIGNDLFRTVFQGQVRTLLDKSLGQIERSQDLGLRLKIKLDPNDEDTGALADLPWELICDAATEDFFALSRQMSVVRYLDVPRSSQPIPFTPPLRILAVGASPLDLEPLDLEEEKERLEKLNQNSSGVQVEFLLNASAGAVREKLAKDTFNVLHFMGHGAFDSTTGEGMLAFEAPDRSMDLVSGKAFATKLKDLRSLGVVVLNACETARARHRQGSSPFRGVANALVLGGIPAVVAMQRPISDVAAIRFSSAFYRNLAQGDSIDEALTEGRQAIHSARPEDYEWATPVLFLRIPDGNVFVARPASQPDVLAPPPPPPDSPTLAPSDPSPARRSPLLKVAAGAAGAAMVIFAVSTQFPQRQGEPGPSDTPEQVETPDGSGLQPTPTPENIVDRTVKRQPVGDRKVKEPDPEPADSAAQLHSTPPPAPSPTISEASTADLSSLSAELQKITRTESGGVRVTVRFRNSANLPLSALIDQETSNLSSNGRPYSILDSSLPSDGSNWRVDLAASSSLERTFDFGEPTLGSTEFLLTLKAVDGSRVKTTGGPVKLEGSL